MDLGICPRCGKDWPGGEYCPNCGFIPIGAGLSRLPKKKKKKVKPYREPGSATPFLVILALIGGVGSVYRSAPWENGWDKLRALFGHARIHDIQGNWDVVKLLQTSTVQTGPLVAARADQVTFVFNANFGVTVKIQRMGHEVDATGTYLVDGTLVHIKYLRTPDDGGPPLPNTMDLPLAWTGENEVVTATAPGEEAYMQRETSATMVALRTDRITTSYSTHEDDANGPLTKPIGGG